MEDTGNQINQIMHKDTLIKLEIILCAYNNPQVLLQLIFLQ